MDKEKSQEIAHIPFQELKKVVIAFVRGEMINRLEQAEDDEILFGIWQNPKNPS